MWYKLQVIFLKNSELSDDLSVEINNQLTKKSVSSPLIHLHHSGFVFTLIQNCVKKGIFCENLTLRFIPLFIMRMLKKIGHVMMF